MASEISSMFSLPIANRLTALKSIVNIKILFDKIITWRNFNLFYVYFINVMIIPINVAIKVATATIMTTRLFCTEVIELR